MREKIAALLLAVGFVSCAPMERDDFSVDFKMLGKWEWVETLSGDEYVNAEGIGSDVFLVFYPNQTYALYKNDELFAEGEFSLGKQNSLFKQNQGLSIHFKPEIKLPEVVFNGAIAVDSTGELIISDHQSRVKSTRFMRL